MVRVFLHIVERVHDQVDLGADIGEFWADLAEQNGLVFQATKPRLICRRKIVLNERCSYPTQCRNPSSRRLASIPFRCHRPTADLSSNCSRLNCCRCCSTARRSNLWSSSFLRVKISLSKRTISTQLLSLGGGWLLRYGLLRVNRVWVFDQKRLRNDRRSPNKSRLVEQAKARNNPEQSKPIWNN